MDEKNDLNIHGAAYNKWDYKSGAFDPELLRMPKEMLKNPNNLDPLVDVTDQIINGPIEVGSVTQGFCVGGGWKLPSGKYLCLVDPHPGDWYGMYFQYNSSVFDVTLFRYHYNNALL